MTQTQTLAEPRTHTFSWTDPAVHAAALGVRTGLETLQAMASGELPPPPVMSMLGEGTFAVEEGTVVVELVPREFHYNPLGSVHGGVIATLLDTAAACAVHSTLPAGVGYTSLDLSTRFIRPASVASGLLRCEGTVISRGRRTAVAQSQLTDARGALLAHATTTCLIFEMPSR
jgi:uncharacterized protein (TIGR00369 family)